MVLPVKKPAASDAIRHFRAWIYLIHLHQINQSYGGEVSYENQKLLWNRCADYGAYLERGHWGRRCFSTVGLYILHPNNVGRCGHIVNASYAIDSGYRGKHIGEQLVSDCLNQAKEHGFKLMQFNAVVENNVHARHLYERLGFVLLGTIPNGFLMKDGTYQNICLYYYIL